MSHTTAEFIDTVDARRLDHQRGLPGSGLPGAASGLSAPGRSRVSKWSGICRRDTFAALARGAGVALLASLVALGLAFVLEPWLRQSAFVLLLGAVTLSAWYGGLGPGLLATACGALAFNSLLSDPGQGSADLGVFGLVSLLITVLYVRLREAHRREEAARHTAEEAIRLRDGFLAAAAHDLRNPLTSITGTCQLLRQRVHHAEPRNGERWASAVDRIDTAARRLAAQVDQLLDVACTEAGRPLGLRLVQMDLVVLVRRVVAERESTSARHSFQVEADPDQLIGSFDPVRLERVFDNLVSNAIKYSPFGGAVTVALHCQAIANETWAVLSVRDEGLGIPAADLPGVLEPFRRASNVGPISGRGIGLASARHIVEEHGGRISVESREGAGTTFTVWLPLALASRPGLG